ncbi:DNA gyrase inhibitor YacG [Sphingopyxis granuli]|uniref:DNA gyrase inhibitor YacG n=1 Tax=Sphingopyxis TaxID=165697 RepID=UPI00086C7DDF|nr:MULTISPECIES: DNA gyrase inhibitor YacG [Sphingopyxis]APW73042.1 DNA gyrase inhibitor YacG [Sphingopyxis granuli]AVA13339.1 DNA gyrase inhibitor YacG [Sphingopyxis sp. MG]ODU28797.1 MAG: DNA gyrase inhibitor YacG [Sphingopyxis sp. SCN 67-31]UNK81134.1 DNA gyrase inhibitor YacG [Sphingopyxis granuli]
MPNERSARARRCPLCGKPRDEAYKPFCSRGCRDRDLNAWFGEGYRVPVDQPPDGGADGGRQSED